jgi:formamidopyrimidine-DNA glycosylase
MPELPEVELYRRLLNESGLNKRIARVTVLDARILGGLKAGELKKRLEGGSLLSTRRHGKHLLARIDKNGWLALHFGMTGGLHFFERLQDEPPFDRVRLDFASGGHLGYTNKRMIGRVGIADNVDSFVAAEGLGPDVLDKRFGFAAFKATVAGTKRDVKSVLMDQAMMAGIGNVYADEILFQAGIRPKTRMDELDPTRLERLYRRMRKVLETAIERGAGSETFVERLPRGSLVPERKKGGRCPRCGEPLQIFKAGARTGYYCAHCQT